MARRSPASASDAERSGEVTRLLHEAGAGSADAVERLYPLVYDELRAVAGRCFRSERAGHTLQPTAVVHEAWMRLVGSDQPAYANRCHFLAIAATTMRRVLVDHARARDSRKRGGDQTRVTLVPGADEAAGAPDPDVDAAVLSLHAALEELALLDERHARIVELRYFGGLTTEEIAEHLGVSERTVRGDWAMARAWLKRRLRELDSD